MASWFWGTSQFDEAIDKATSELNVSGSEDIALNLEICDQIRSKSVGPKEAMRAIKRRLNHQNPNVQLLALSLVDICIKNGGDHFLVEIASREFMDNLASILKIPALNAEVRTKLLRLVQNWAIGFEGKPSLTYVREVYKTLQREGFTFPPKDTVAANSAMVDSATAPEWIDSDVCLRCRTPFSFTNRKHHCRNCGQVFDQACSSKVLPLPSFGITQDVRVCDTCYVKLKKKNVPLSGVDSKHRRSHSQSHSASRPKHRPAQDVADEELQRAIALSLQDARSTGSRPGYIAAAPQGWSGVSEPPVVNRPSKPYSESVEDDPDLKAAIEASLREASAPRPSAPLDTGLPAQVLGNAVPQLDPGSDLHPLESDAIMTFSQTVEEAQARGSRDFVRYPGVSELYSKANDLRPKLAISLDETSRKEELLSDMHEKLSEAVKLYDQLLTQQLNPIRNQRNQQAAYTQLPSQVPQPQPTRLPPAQAPAPPPQWAPDPQGSFSTYSAPGALPTAPPPQSPYMERQYSYQPQPATAVPYGNQPGATQDYQAVPVLSAPASYVGHNVAQAASPPPQAQQWANTSVPTFSNIPQFQTVPLHPMPQQTMNPAETPQLQLQPTIQPSVQTLPAPLLYHHPSGLAVPQIASPAPSISPLNISHAVSSPPVQFSPVPNFPAAPTAIPSTLGYYSAPPEGIERKEQKEALLISFD